MQQVKTFEKGQNASPASLTLGGNVPLALRVALSVRCNGAE